MSPPTVEPTTFRVALPMKRFWWFHGSSPVTVPNRKLPAAVAIVVDTSIRMGTMAENSARLAKAQEAAHRILSSLPAGSRAAILDNLGENDTFRAQQITLDLDTQSITLSGNVKGSVTETKKAEQPKEQAPVESEPQAVLPGSGKVDEPKVEEKE